MGSQTLRTIDFGIEECFGLRPKEKQNRETPILLRISIKHIVRSLAASNARIWTDIAYSNRHRGAATSRMWCYHEEVGCTLGSARSLLVNTEMRWRHKSYLGRRIQHILQSDIVHILFSSIRFPGPDGIWLALPHKSDTIAISETRNLWKYGQIGRNPSFNQGSNGECGDDKALREDDGFLLKTLGAHSMWTALRNYSPVT